MTRSAPATAAAAVSKTSSARREFLDRLPDGGGCVRRRDLARKSLAPAHMCQGGADQPHADKGETLEQRLAQRRPKTVRHARGSRMRRNP